MYIICECVCVCVCVYVSVCESLMSLPTASSMKEPWEEKVKRVKRNSPYSHLPNWSKHHIASLHDISI